jgi:hypothetical protein
MTRVSDHRPRSSPEPRQIFREAERLAIEMRTLLGRCKSDRKNSGISGSMDNAVSLARLVEKLARIGRNLPAAEAVELAGRIETFVEMLRAEIDALLNS